MVEQNANSASQIAHEGRKSAAVPCRTMRPVCGT
jgi:hypothetical protein